MALLGSVLLDVADHYILEWHNLIFEFFFVEALRIQNGLLILLDALRQACFLYLYFVPSLVVQNRLYDSFIQTAFRFQLLVIIFGLELVLLHLLCYYFIKFINEIKWCLYMLINILYQTLVAFATYVFFAYFLFFFVFFFFLRALAWLVVLQKSLVNAQFLYSFTQFYNFWFAIGLNTQFLVFEFVELPTFELLYPVEIIIWD